MWCAHCQTEVAAEVAGDNRRIHCASCGQEIASTRDRTPVSTTQEARELLERWSNDRIVDPYGPLRKSPRSTAGASENEPPKMRSGVNSATNSTETEVDPPPKPSSAKRLRIDGAQSIPRSPSVRPVSSPIPVQHPSRETLAETASTPTGNTSERSFRIDEAHAGPSPHFDLARAESASAMRPVNWMAVAGQWLSYLGVLALTAGAGLVLLGYFRGPGSYLPTGWLVTMAGQMLLFLGVMTTFSTGMEKTTNTVSRKIDDLGERIIRIEAAARELSLASRSPVSTESSEPTARATSA